jgi:branched-chain amino acid transport system permease protein
MIEKSALSSGKSNKDKLAKLSPYLALIIVIAIIPLFTQSSYYLHILILTFIYIIVSVSFRFIAISGQFPLAHIVFMGIGGYASGVLAIQLKWSPWLTMPIGALLAMAIGILIGFPFVRLRALYYALVSLFFGVGMIEVVTAFGRYTGGIGGLVGIPGIPGLISTNKVPYYYFILGVTIICLLILYRFEYSRIGTNLKAIDQSHLVASSIGINEASYRILALAIGCFFAGLAGAIYAHYNYVLSPASFQMSETLWIVMYVLIGGIGSFAGPIVGTIVLFLVPEFYSSLRTVVPFISAALMLAVVFLIPDGIVSLPGLLKLRLEAIRKSKGNSNVV